MKSLAKFQDFERLKNFDFISLKLYQSFQRNFELPKNVVDEDKISACYVNGLLISQYPKRRKLNRNLLE
ncbi:MAG TPA: Hsp20/alpha crystallin family protein [Flavobacterium sp.]|uniref:Hsp20/alpha crystallin family protein n=1 Tax=Flavobacterium sp. TaxID=239 RepID=UPI002ED3D331